MAGPRADATARPVIAAEADLRSLFAGRLDPIQTAQPEAPLRAPIGDPDPALDGLATLELAPAAVLVGLVRRAEGYRVILTRRSDALRRHTGQVAFPGGRCDPGETPARAAVREAHEEIGLEPAQVSLLGLSTAYHTPTGFHVTPVVGLVDPDFAAEANPAEVAEVFEPPFDFLMEASSYEEREGVFQGATRRFLTTTWQGYTIWGVTAAMLQGLRQRLYGA